uniref:Uncharacterized protein n=1 Tax=Nothobranchius furzeri TaxID=105023 RepID=A0A8C6MF36_NOTFU
MAGLSSSPTISFLPLSASLPRGQTCHVVPLTLSTYFHHLAFFFFSLSPVPFESKFSSAVSLMNPCCLHSVRHNSLWCPLSVLCLFYLTATV